MMDVAPLLQEHFQVMEDPRVSGRIRHELVDVVVIAICGLLCGAEGWVEIEEFGRAKEKWLRNWLSLPNGIPSHDTFGRVFSLVDPEKFQACFRSWIEALNDRSDGRLVAIDGKTSRRSHGRGQTALHTVSAWVAENRIVLGQINVRNKSNEITAIPELLEQLDVAGAVVTIDAAGCQKAIAEKIVACSADYILAVKGNQPALLKEIQRHFSDADDPEYPSLRHDRQATDEFGHGRHEIREVDTIVAPARIGSLNPKAAWPRLQAIVRVQTHYPNLPERTPTTRFYISSLPGNAAAMARAIRGHWTIENQLHWSLDVSFREDDSRVRIGHAQANLVVLRHIALVILKRETSLKRGLKVKRLRAGWDHTYLERLVALALQPPSPV